MRLLHLPIFLLVGITACTTSPNAKIKNATLPNRGAFQQTVDGQQTDLYTLKNANKMEVALTNYGARVVSLLVPDNDNNIRDVVLGFDSIAQYVRSTEPYYGATIGRYANRIANAKFSLEGSVFNLDRNNPPNTLHGGKEGFQNKVWKATQLSDSSVAFLYFSKDGEEGFPGNLATTVTYTLTANNELQITYQATTDKKTVVNFTNHAFFNLNGDGASILNHQLYINADTFTPVDTNLIPTGVLQPVENTPFDFRKRTTIGARAEADDAQLKAAHGYDHNFVLNKNNNEKLSLAATVNGEKAKGGIVMDVYTDQSGMQFYIGNSMPGNNILRMGKDTYRTAFCLETQHFPDAPNQPTFPSTILAPKQTFKSTTVYHFGIITKF